MFESLNVPFRLDPRRIPKNELSHRTPNRSILYVVKYLRPILIYILVRGRDRKLTLWLIFIWRGPESLTLGFCVNDKSVFLSSNSGNIVETSKSSNVKWLFGRLFQLLSTAICIDVTSSSYLPILYKLWDEKLSRTGRN